MGETGKLTDFLRRSVLFRDLPEKDLRRISLNFEIVTLPMGEVLFYEKEESGDMYIVLDPDPQLLWLRLRRDTFLRIVRENPHIAVNVIKALVSRLRKTDDMLEALAFRSVEGRIIKFLLEKGRERGSPEGGAYRVRKMTHRDLASRVGASREAVTKALKAELDP